MDGKWLIIIIIIIIIIILKKMYMGFHYFIFCILNLGFPSSNSLFSNTHSKYIYGFLGISNLVFTYIYTYIHIILYSFFARYFRCTFLLEEWGVITFIES